MRIQKLHIFWVVTKPTDLSELEDICFKSDVIHLERQFRGGLKVDEILATFVDENKAKEFAIAALENWKFYQGSMQNLLDQI